MKRVIVFLFLVVLTLSVFPLDSFAQQDKGSRPNIIIIITDQQYGDAMSYFMGKQWINTPAMDSLASQGVVFTRAYAANPICAPSRNSIITGQYPHSTGIEDNEDLAGFNSTNKDKHFWSGKGMISMGTYFRKAGYETAYFGKWHLNFSPKDKKINGFDIMHFATGSGDDDSLPVYVSRFLKEEHKRPFLLFISFLNPHNICQWSRFQSLPNGSIGSLPPLDQLPPVPANLLPPKNESDAMTLMRESYHNNLKLFPVGNYTAFDWRRLRWGYYRLIEKVDSLVGDVLHSINENGYQNNSLIVYTSDHGSCVGAHEFVQKTVFYDESSKVPFILDYPPMLRHSLNQTLVNTGIDILPTILDFARAKIPPGLPGKSLKVTAGTGKTQEVPYIVVENKMDQGGPVNGAIPICDGRMVRDRRYKYCLYSIGQRHEELYDMIKDPLEKINIAYEPSMITEIKKFRKYLFEFATKYHDTVALKMLGNVEKDNDSVAIK